MRFRSAAVGLLLVACSASDPATPPAAQVCAADPRVSAFKVGIESVSSAKTMRVRIASATPTWVVQGVNEWTLAITDGSGAPLDGLTISIKPVMPDHGHGSSTVPVVTPLGAGQYRATGISLPMRGVWNVTINATGAVNDSVTFTFCVDGQ